MTTDEKIRVLAQSYVDELFAHDDMTEQENIEAKNDALVMCMAFAGHILETHCIVEKDKAMECYGFTQIRGIQQHDDVVAADAVAEAMEALFGKELFNGKENDI